MTMGRDAVPGTSGDLSVLDSPKNRAVRELERHGYVAEPNFAGSPGGAICRHPVAPSLLVGDDGRIELVRGQPDTRGRALARPSQNSIRWRRALIFLALLGGASFLGLLMVAMVVG